MKSLVCLLLIVTSALSMAKCAMRGKVVVFSPGYRYKLTLDPDGSFTMLELGKQTVATKGKLDVVGHHYNVWISDTGDRIVLVDEYAGYGVFDRKGKALKMAGTERFLTETEIASTPHKWPCHPEGKWLSQYTLDDRVLSMTVFNKRVVRVALR